MVLSINIHEKEQFVKKCLKKKDTGTKASNFFGTEPADLETIFTSEEGQCEQKINLNTSIWCNFEVISQTGYSIEMIKEPLYHLAFFIQENLQPNRLEGFDIEHVKTLKDNH